MKLRRRLCLLGTGLVLGLVGIFFFRGQITLAAVTAGLRHAGAGEIKMEVSRSTPWAVQLDNVAFKIKAQPFAARRVSLERTHWWQPTLGTVHLEGVKVPVTIDGSDTNPFAWNSYAGETSSTGGAFQVPLEKLSIEGVLLVRTSAHEQPLELKFEAQPAEDNSWHSTLRVTGPGLVFNAEGKYGLRDKRISFHSTALSLDLSPWEHVVQQLVVLPLGPWSLAGQVTGEIQGTNDGGKLVVSGRIQLGKGQLKNASGTLAAQGIAADLDFTDLREFQTKPGSVRVDEFRTGKLIATELEAGITLLDSEQVTVESAAMRILGGRITAEPFKFVLGQRELEAVVLADGLDVEQLLALTKDLPAKASGRVDGRLPIRLDENGLRLGTGWLQLKQGVYAEIQLHAAGLITGGMDPSGASYQIMKRVENGLLRLKLGALRLDVRPPDAPRGRSARLHLEGDPVDPGVKAPVILDLNVNGPLEQLLNFGLQQNFSVGVGQ